MIYADTSFLFSLYVWDRNTQTASDTMAKERRRPVCLTPWQHFELKNVTRTIAGGLAKSKQPARFQPGTVFKQVRADLQAGRLKHEEVDWPEALRLAESLSSHHAEHVEAGAVDFWHVAAAILLEADTFWTFDEPQWELARRSRRFTQVPKLPTA